EGDRVGSFQIASRPSSGGEWVEHAQGRVRAGDANPAAGETDRAGWRPAPLEPQERYRSLALLGIEYGPCIQGLVNVETSGDLLRGHLRPPPAEAGYLLHPCLLDAGLQLLWFRADATLAWRPAVPVRLEKFVFHGLETDQVQGY